jgi:error-prone DNA polymerase
MSAARYAELQCTSHFSFLRGASSCEELFAQAAMLGIEALAITDRNSLAGIVRAHEASRTTGVRLIVGCRLDLIDGTSVLVYPTDRPAYARLCRLLSLGKKRAGKAQCRLDWSDLVTYGEGLLTVLIPDEADETCGFQLRRLAEAFGNRAFMALTLRRRPNDALRLHDLANQAARARVHAVVTNDVLFDVPRRRILQDVVTCIRHNITIDEAGFPPRDCWARPKSITGFPCTGSGVSTVTLPGRRCSAPCSACGLVSEHRFGAPNEDGQLGFEICGVPFDRPS